MNTIGELWERNARACPERLALVCEEGVANRFERHRQMHDEFVRRLLTATGSTFRDGATTVFRDRRSPDEIVTMTSQLFLGVRLECAKCHHHPTEKWDLTDYYQMAAFFTQMKRKGQGISAPISGEPEYIWAGGEGAVSHPVTGENLSPAPPDGPEAQIESGADPRAAFAQWLHRADIPQSAYVVVVTRGHRHDLDALRALAARDLRYLGLIGSRAKVKKIYDALE